MEQFKVSCYEAFTNSDLTEGKGGHVTIGYFFNEMDARKAARGKGVMGTNGDVKAVKLDTKVFESYAEYDESRSKDVRLSALNKLTAEERRILGLE